MTLKNSLSKLSDKEKEELYNFLLEYEIDYRPNLNLSSDLTFGMEIELISNEKYEERKNLLLWLFADVEAHSSPSYEQWWLTNEFNLTKSDNEYGYEVVSPILKNTEKDWKQILETLNGLYQMKYNVNDLCASHIHFGVGLMNKRKVINLLKIWSIYEDILYRFGYGEFCNARPLLTKYANPISSYIKEFLQVIPDDIELISLLNNLPPGHSSGLNLNNYRNTLMELHNTIKTIEVRCPNGTMNPIIWQNNINTFGKLLELIYSDNYDEEKLDYQMLYSKIPEYDEYHYSKINFEKALEFADLIFEENIDKFNFLRQYIKDGKEKNEGKLQKSLAFTKKILHN